MSRLELFKMARQRSESVLRAKPFLFPLESVVAQLDYLVAIEKGYETDLGPLRTMDLGQIAARDVEAVDPDLAELLHLVSAEVHRMLLTHQE